MPHPWHTRKLRGKKAKEQAKRSRAQKRESIPGLEKRLKEIRSNAPEAVKRRKKTSQWFSCLEKTWHIRYRLLCGVYGKLYRTKYNKRFASNKWYLATKDREKFYWPLEKKVRNHRYWRD